MSRMERLVFWGALAVLLASGITKLALFVEAASYVTGDTGGELREGIVGQPAFINPIVPVSEADRDISRLVFSSLTDVSDSIKPSPDNRSYTVRLKENALWHDGERLTADDVIFTVKTIEDSESRSPLYRSFQGVEAERVSELEVKFSLSSPYAFFEDDHLKNLQIIPKHIFAGIPAQNLRLSAYGLRPIGSGPYAVKDYESDSRGSITSLTLKENDRYFGEQPKIGTIVFKFFSDSNGLIRAYNSGAIDAFSLSTFEPAVSNLAVRYEAHYLSSLRYYAIFINPTTTPKELKDLKVRAALSGLVERAKLVEDVFDGRGRVLYGPTELSPDPATDYDAKLVQGLSLELTVPDEPFLTKTADIIKREWEAAGINVTLRTLPVKTIQEETLKNSDYTMLLFGNITKESRDLFAFWHSSRRFYPDQNLALYQNKLVDAELETYRRTFDPKERLQILKRVSDLISRDIPAIFLYSPDYLYIATPNLGGFGGQKYIGTAADRFSDVADWYVKTKRVFR